MQPSREPSRLGGVAGRTTPRDGRMVRVVTVVCEARVGGGMASSADAGVRDKDAEFSEYMAARQPSLLRTAYLLTGDRHTAEDLVQTALAKLYLSWDKVQRQDSLD